MKECVKCLMAALVAIIGVTTNAAWTFYPEEGTLPDGKTYVGTVTDGVVTFHVTGNKNNQLTINAKYGYFNDKTAIPEEFSIDFTEIYDAQKTTPYYAVSFGNFSYQTSCYFKGYAERLTEFIAPDLTEIFGSGCFGNCINLTKVKLSDGFTSFSSHRPFIGCKSLVDFEPKELNITSIPIEAFSGCAKLAGEFSFPICNSSNGGGKWFGGCEEIESIKMPLMTSIEGNSFSGCKKLKYVEFSKEISKISSTAFSGCASLSGDCIRAMLNPGITRLGSNDGDVKNIFSNCSSFDGALEWNFPNLASTNVVGASYFEKCTSLQEVAFKTYVYEIRGSAFCDLAPGAEIFMHPEPVKIFGKQSVGNTKGPFIKVYIDEESEDEWVDVIDKTYHVMRKENFNNRSWSDETTDGISTRSRDNMVERMIEDQLMCAKDANTGDVKINQRNVIAFCMQDKSGGNFSRYSCFWLIWKSKTGLKAIVR